MTAPTKSFAPAPAEDSFDRRLTYGAWGATLLLFGGLMIPLLGGRMFAVDDLSAFHLPLRYLYQRALQAGHSVLWSSQLFSGFYIHAEGQVGAFHPLHLLLYWALPLAIAFTLELILSYVFAFAGMWRYLRHSGLVPASSIVGALAFAFSGFTLLHLPHMNAIAVIAHIPWLLLAIDVAVADPGRTRRNGVVSISLLFGSQALLGYPQYLWMSALICLLYVSICLRARLLEVLLAGVAAVAGLMLGGIQLLPSFDLLATSVRRAFGSDFALSYSLHPLNILQLFSPYLLLNRIYAAPHELLIHEFGVYSGALATIAFTWGIFRWRTLPFPRLALFAGATSVLGLVLALGRYGMFYEWLTMVPLIGNFRAPTRHIMLVHFGFAVLVAILFEDLRQLCVTKSRAARQQTWLWLPVLISACAAALAWWRPQIWGTFPDQPLFGSGIVVGGILLAVVTLLVSDAARGSRSALLSLPVIFALDLGLWGFGYVYGGGMATISELAARANPPAAEPGSTVHEPARTPELNGLLLHDLRVLRPYVGLQPLRRLVLATDDALRVSGAQWVSGETGWRRVADPMPRVRFVPEWRVVKDPGELSGVDIRQTALLTDEVQAASGTVGNARLVIDEPAQIVVDVSTRGSALLVTTEAFDKGWRATGASGAVLRTTPVYGDYLGVVVEPGEYRMTLSFVPESFTKGLYTSLSGLLLVALVGGIASRTHRG